MSQENAFSGEGNQGFLFKFKDGEAGDGPPPAGGPNVAEKPASRHSSRASSRASSTGRAPGQGSGTGQPATKVAERGQQETVTILQTLMESVKDSAQALKNVVTSTAQMANDQKDIKSTMSGFQAQLDEVKRTQAGQSLISPSTVTESVSVLAPSATSTKTVASTTARAYAMQKKTMSAVASSDYAKSVLNAAKLVSAIPNTSALQKFQLSRVFVEVMDAIAAVENPTIVIKKTDRDGRKLTELELRALTVHEQQLFRDGCVTKSIKALLLDTTAATHLSATAIAALKSFYNLVRRDPEFGPVIPGCLAKVLSLCESEFGTGGGRSAKTAIEGTLQQMAIMLRPENMPLDLDETVMEVELAEMKTACSNGRLLQLYFGIDSASKDPASQEALKKVKAEVAAKADVKQQKADAEHAAKLAVVAGELTASKATVKAQATEIELLKAAVAALQDQ
jgi:hypothetical protein